MNEDFLNRKLQQRRDTHSLRQLRSSNGLVDFCSNDYLGIVTNGLIKYAAGNAEKLHGSTGSRLVTGNYELIEETEKEIALFHNAAAGLIFNSGYDANTGLLSCVLQRGDTVLYDTLSHASIRDGIRLSHAHSFSFDHNNVEELEKKLQSATGNIFVVTESVFSMDGDMAPLKKIAELCASYSAHLIVDEAHATGVTGAKGEGLVQSLGLEKSCFARVHTFGKAVGCHGAVVLGSAVLRDYLVNFSRPFIYTTALPAVSVMAVRAAYRLFPGMIDARAHLQSLISAFRSAASGMAITESSTPVQAVIIAGNEEAGRVAAACQNKGFDLRAILYPTVPLGKERLRVVLHSFNTQEEVRGMVEAITSAKLVGNLPG